ncbi:MAG: PEGA domain-containing protein [Polyangiales bacterium]
MAVSMILTVESVPTAAQVFVDEKFSGETPVDLDLVEGRHVLRLKKSLYRELERDVDAVAGETVTWKLELEAIPEAERLAMEPLPPDAWSQQPTTWILIGGAAAVVAAGVVLAVVLSSDSPSAASGFCAKVDDCVRVP